jgi:signal transduction histidine kinase
VALSPDADLVVGIALSVTLLLIVVRAITGDRDRARREVLVMGGARQAHLHRRQFADSLLDDAGTDPPTWAGPVASRLRVSLADISAEADALRGEASGLLSARHHALLDGVRAGVRRLQELNENLTEYAMADSSAWHVGDVGLTALAAEVAADRRALSPGLAPRIMVSELPVVRGDVTLLRQVLDILVKNAVEHATPGHPAQVAITATRDGSVAHLVEVVGSSTPDESRDHLAAPFHRDRHGRPLPSGSGLGLATASRIIRRHGGSIGAETGAGGGIRFWFTLPA